MFNWLKKKPAPEPSGIREVLFGDLPFDSWPPQSAELTDTSSQQEEPWSLFVQANQLRKNGQQAEAIRTLRAILARPELESRHYLQAWHFLRELGVQPTEEAKQVYGVVVEVALPEGLDIVAAYTDRTARYFNFSGAGVVWDRPDDSLDSYIDALLQSGAHVVAQIGPWEQPRPSAPPKGQVRINMLTPSGLHFGQADMDILSKDAMGGPVIAQATELVLQLIAKSEAR